MNRIKELRKKSHVSQQELAKILNVHQTAISQWETGRTSPDIKTAQKIAGYFHTSVGYVLDFDEMIEPKSYDYIIPVLGRVEAGIPYTAIEEIIDEEQLAPDTDMNFEYVGLQIHGASMEPRMKEGDVVIVRIQEFIDDGDIAVVFVNGDEATIKKIKKTPGGISLIPLNPAFEPLFYSNEEIESLPVRIFGKVVELRAKF